MKHVFKTKTAQLSTLPSAAVIQILQLCRQKSLSSTIQDCYKSIIMTNSRYMMTSQAFGTVYRVTMQSRHISQLHFSLLPNLTNTPTMPGEEQHTIIPVAGW